MPDLPNIPKEELKEIFLLAGTTGGLIVKQFPTPEVAKAVGSIMDALDLFASLLGVTATEEEKVAAALAHLKDADEIAEIIKKL